MFSEKQNVLKNIFENIFIKNTYLLETYQKMNVQLLLIVPVGHFEVGVFKMGFRHFGYVQRSFWL